MHSLPPVTGAPNLAVVSADRSVPQIVANYPAPVMPAETNRPVRTPVPVTDISVDPNPIQAGGPSPSPMAVIVEILTRADGGSPGQKADAIAPPVPLRYLSAFMLQSAIARDGQIDEKVLILKKEAKTIC